MQRPTLHARPAFSNVRSADGDVNDLAKLAEQVLNINAGKLIHIGGDHSRAISPGSFEQLGFRVERRVAYASVMASALPGAFTQHLDVVLFHSARAAEAFAALGAPERGEPYRGMHERRGSRRRLSFAVETSPRCSPATRRRAAANGAVALTTEQAQLLEQLN